MSSLGSSSSSSAAGRSKMSDAEAAVYDRQIRLWGAEAQKKLRDANILIAGINGVGSEIIKNIVLAGVNSVTLLDDKQVTQSDSTCNLFTKRQLNKSRVEVAHKHIQALNPMVDVKHEDANINDKEDAYFENFDVVCLSGYDSLTINRVNSICNKLNIKFYATCTWGLFAFTFTDLGSTHTYFTESVVILLTFYLFDYLFFFFY